MKKFIYETILQPENICNLTQDRADLLESVTNGERVVFFGRRNTGKSSLVKSIIIPAYKKANKESMAVFVDLMGVTSIESITKRINYAIEQALSECSKTEQVLTMIGKIIKKARPSISLDPITGTPAITLGLDLQGPEQNIYALFNLLAAYHEKQGILIVIDEFQDIAYVKEAAAILRNVMQNLPGRLPIVILGSKKHLLSNLFANPNAPFASWGKFQEISKISAVEYQKYIQERFLEKKLLIDKNATTYLIKLLDNIPEAINIVSDQLLKSHKNTQINNDQINVALKKTLDNRSSLFEERFLRFSPKERTFLEQLAKEAPVSQLTSKYFLTKTNLSAGGASALIKRLEEDAVIYKTSEGYVVSDPLMSYYLKIH